MPDVSGLCRHRRYLPTPPRVRGHINIYWKYRYLAVLFQVIIRRNGSVVHMTNHRTSTAPWVGVLTAHGAARQRVPSRVRTSVHVTTLSFNRPCSVVRTRVASRVSDIYTVMEFIAAKKPGRSITYRSVCPLYDNYTIKLQSKCLVKPQHPITYQEVVTNILTYLTLKSIRNGLGNIRCNKWKRVRFVEEAFLNKVNLERSQNKKKYNCNTRKHLATSTHQCNWFTLYWVTNAVNLTI